MEQSEQQKKTLTQEVQDSSPQAEASTDKP